MVWACAVRGGQWLGEELYGVWSGGCWTGGGPGKSWTEVVQGFCWAYVWNVVIILASIRRHRKWTRFM